MLETDPAEDSGITGLARGLIDQQLPKIEDGTWSIVDVRTGKIAVVADTLALKRLDETAAMEIMDALHQTNVDYDRVVKPSSGEAHTDS